jgi:hypothetical protein
MSEPTATSASIGLIPNQFVLMWPTLQALKDLGGSARISEIVERVIAAEGFSEEQQAVKRRDGDHMPRSSIDSHGHVTASSSSEQSRIRYEEFGL